MLLGEAGHDLTNKPDFSECPVTVDLDVLKAGMRK